MNMNTINGRTPEEIKRGLECCSVDGLSCSNCSYCVSCDADIHALERDALAYIQQLESAQSKWISIKEQLPTRELRVLTINGHGLIRIFGFFKRTEKAWTWIDDAGHFNHCNDITHWMPLPSTEGICLNAKL